MTIYNYSQLRQLARNAGFSAQAAGVAAAVAMAESSGNSNAENHNSNGSTDYGLWQINSIHSGTFGTPGARWLNPQYNAQMAHSLWKSQGFQPWVKYNNGDYRMYLSNTNTTVSKKSQAVAQPAMAMRSGGGSVQNASLTGGLEGFGAGLASGNPLNSLIYGVEGLSSSGNPVSGFLDLFKTYTKVFALLLTGSFWIRLGLGALGVGIVIAAIILMAESNKTVQRATKTAGEAAVLA